SAFEASGWEGEPRLPSPIRRHADRLHAQQPLRLRVDVAAVHDAHRRQPYPTDWDREPPATDLPPVRDRGPRVHLPPERERPLDHDDAADTLARREHPLAVVLEVVRGEAHRSRE